MPATRLPGRNHARSQAPGRLRTTQPPPTAVARRSAGARLQLRLSRLERLTDSVAVHLVDSIAAVSCTTRTRMPESPYREPRRDSLPNWIRSSRARSEPATCYFSAFPGRCRTSDCIWDKAVSFMRHRPAGLFRLRVWNRTTTRKPSSGQGGHASSARRLPGLDRLVLNYEIVQLVGERFARFGLRSCNKG